MSQDSKNIHRCLDWALKEGAVVQGISATQLPGRGTSLVTIETTDPRAIHVPIRLLLNLQNITSFAVERPEFAAILAEWSTRVPMTSRRSIVLLMAYSSRHGSPWSSYLAALPRHIESPLFWTAEERRLLEGTSISGVAEDKLAFLNAWLSYQQRQEKASLFTHSLTVAEIMHYEMLVDSRALLSDEADSCMVPVIDFANHSSVRSRDAAGHQNASWETDSSGFHLYIHGNVAPGEEVLFSYGKRGNGELLFKYGFVEASQTANGSRSVTIEMQVDDADDHLTPFGEPSFRITSDMDDEPLVDDESGFLWICALEDEPHMDWEQQIYKGTLITKENVLALLQAQSPEEWQWLQFKACTIALQCLTAQLRKLDALEEDEGLCMLAESIDSHKLAMIDAVRDSERITLQMNIERLSNKQTRLSESVDIRKRLQL